LILVGSKVTDNGDGTFDYEYAIHNLNCDRSIGSIEIPTGNAAISNVGFKDINYNSGEIYDSTDWSSAVLSNSVNWNTVTYEENPNGNALRWGTMYNFSFTASASPVVGDIQLGLFKPGGPSAFSMATNIPGGASDDPCDLPLGSCPEDVDGDSIVAVGDILAVVAYFGDCGDGTYRPIGDVDGDCCVTVSDLLAVVAAWGNDCAPVGACCLSGGGCSDAVSQGACVNAGGSYQGDDSNCASSNCPTPGACCFNDGSCQELMQTACAEMSGGYQGDGTTCANANCPVAGAGDECVSPFIAVMGANPFDTTTATPSDDAPDAAQCAGTYLDWGNSQDVWFIYVANATGTVRFTTCDANSYDTSMALYEGTCENQVACNGDSDSGNGCQAYHSAIDYAVTSGSSYYIRIGGWQGATGTGTLTIE
jgi:hypothetical protein